MLCAQILFMGHADVFLAHRAVYLSSIKLRVAKKPANLFNRHAAVQSIGRHCSPDPVWMDVFYTGFPAKDPEHSFNAIFGQSAVRLLKRHEQRRIIISAAVEVHFKVYAGGRREVSFAFFGAFSEYSDVVGGEIDI